MPNRSAVRRAATAAIGAFLCAAGTLASAAGPNPLAEDFTFTGAGAQANLTARKAGEGQKDFLTVPKQQSAQKSAGGKSNGRPDPGAFSFVHRYDTATASF